MSTNTVFENNQIWDTSQSKYTRLPVCINDLLFSDYIEDWYMTQQERCTLIALLEKIQPNCAIEVGTLLGGSLSLISKFSTQVYSLDIDSDCKDKLSDKFTNVEFITGDSKETLPALLNELQEKNIAVEFALIDASHTRQGVKQDIENLLSYKPLKPFYIIIHDSFMPECRQGMAEADWEKSPYVHLVELDFVPGRYNVDVNDPANHRKMTCGLAIALMLPFKRNGDLKINAYGQMPFDILKEESIHKQTVKASIKKVKRKAGRAIRKFKKYFSST